MNKYKVYLSDITSNAIKNGDKIIGFGVKTNVIFVDVKKLEDLKEIQKSLYYYLISQDDLEYLENKIEKQQEEIEQLKTDLQEANDNVEWWHNRYNAVVKMSNLE